jgi:hypothetical protein
VKEKSCEMELAASTGKARQWRISHGANEFMEMAYDQEV